MTTLEVIGSVVLVITAADRIPAAIAGFLRAWIPAVRALHDLMREIRAAEGAQIPDQGHGQDWGSAPASPCTGRTAPGATPDTTAPARAGTVHPE